MYAIKASNIRSSVIFQVNNLPCVRSWKELEESITQFNWPYCRGANSMNNQITTKPDSGIRNNADFDVVMRQLIFLWEQFNEETKEDRLALKDDQGNQQYFKGQFDDFVYWYMYVRKP